MPSESAERIFEAATRLFGERGYPSTSMRDIGEAVGLLAPRSPGHRPGPGRGPTPAVRGDSESPLT
ncbi:MAG TPA: helix-turn-helix domain-containing protein [Acidimicrobiia bacterium]|nr:helix-turn-helix domain-containing protein [Acidimicrobiia bacterium]